MNIPSGKHCNGKSPVNGSYKIGKSSQNSVVSMTTFDYQRLVSIPTALDAGPRSVEGLGFAPSGFGVVTASKLLPALGKPGGLSATNPFPQYHNTP